MDKRERENISKKINTSWWPADVKKAKTIYSLEEQLEIEKWSPFFLEITRSRMAEMRGYVLRREETTPNQTTTTITENECVEPAAVAVELSPDDSSPKKSWWDRWFG